MPSTCRLAVASEQGSTIVVARGLEVCVRKPGEIALPVVTGPSPKAMSATGSAKQPIEFNAINDHRVSGFLSEKCRRIRAGRRAARHAATRLR